MSKVTDEQVVFAAGQTPDGVPMVILGIPRAAWRYIRDGKTQTFDLVRAGLPFRLVMFGAKDHDEAMAVLQQCMAADGRAYLDQRREDFSIKPANGGDDGQG